MAVNPNFNKILSEALENNKPTNADRIRAMSDEELAVVIGPSCPEDYRCGKCVSDCVECWLRWLQSPAGGDGDD